MLQRVLLCSSETGYLADRQQQHVLFTAIFLKLYVTTNGHFRRNFSTAPELHYLKIKKSSCYFYSLQQGADRSQDMRVACNRVCSSLHAGGVTNTDYEQVTAFLLFTTLPENWEYLSLPLVMVS